MSDIAWKDGTILWKDGTIAWGDPCICCDAGGPVQTGCCPDPIGRTLTLQEVFTGSTSAPAAYMGLDGMGRHYWQGTLKGCLITITCAGTSNNFLWSGGTIVDSTFNPTVQCDPFLLQYGSPNCDPSVFFEVTA